MKSAIMVIIVGICFAIICILCYHRNKQKANDIKEPWTAHGNLSHTKVVLIEGHKYIILDTDDGANIIHAESCNCKSK
jgi:hypothetical protein